MKFVGQVAAAASAALVLVGVALWKRCSKNFDGLASIVSFSSKLIAASRAVESSEEHPLVNDPLAEGMAGASALAASRRRATPAPQGSERKFKVGKMAIRTRWFDDQIEAALGMPVSARIPGCLRAMGAPPYGDLASYIWTHPAGHEPRQLVMLGAGMDTRPWRMKLPADLHWFEVDQPDVVEAKRKLLVQLAAEVPPAGVALGDPVATAFTPGGSAMGSGLTRHLSIDHVQFPLRCGSWTPVTADLSDPAWADALLMAGFDPTRPTVWVAEGLLMYLEADVVKALLSRIAELSATGSAFLGLSVTEGVIDRVKARQAAGGLKGGSALMSTWVFGCPDDPTELLAGCGWRLQMATDRKRQSEALGLDPELCAFGPTATADAADGGANGKANGGSKEGQSLFLVATPLSDATAAPAAAQ